MYILSLTKKFTLNDTSILDNKMYGVLFNLNMGMKKGSKGSGLVDAQVII